MTLAEVAAILREELLLLLREVGCVGVEGCCTVASIALAEVLRWRGLDAQVAYGIFLADYPEPHTWCLIDWDTVVDVTADQFSLADVTAVAVVPRGDPAIGLYLTQTVGTDAELELRSLYPEDAILADRVARRVRQRILALGLDSDGGPGVVVPSRPCPCPTS